MDNRLPIPASHSQIHWQLPLIYPLHEGRCPTEHVVMTHGRCWSWENLERKLWFVINAINSNMVLIMRKSGGPPFSQVKAANDIRRVIKIRIVQKGFFSDVSHTPIFQGEQWYCEAPEGRDMIIADNYIPPYDHDPQESAESSEII